MAVNFKFSDENNKYLLGPSSVAAEGAGSLFTYEWAPKCELIWLSWTMGVYEAIAGDQENCGNL